MGNCKSKRSNLANNTRSLILENKYNVGTIKDNLKMLIHCEKAETFCHHGKIYLNIIKIKFDSEIKHIVMFITNMLEYSYQSKWTLKVNTIK